jgi:hypothetical protein
MGKKAEARAAARAQAKETKRLEAVRDQAMRDDAIAKPAREAEKLRAEYQQRLAANPFDAAEWLSRVPMREKIIFGDTP